MAAELQSLRSLSHLLKDSGLVPDAEAKQPIAYDASGYLFAYGHDGKLRSLSVREPLLDSAKLDTGADDIDGGHHARQLRVHPPLPAPAQHLEINSLGTFAVAWCQGKEGGEAAMQVIPLTLGGDDVEALPVDDPSLVQRAGLQILQVTWHPWSDSHFAVLASDNVLRLYHVDNLSTPEQQVELQLQSGPLGLPDLERTHMVAFAFGSPELWERFAVYFLDSEGALYALTPLCPFGGDLPTQALQELHRSCDSFGDEDDQRSCTRVWLQRSFPTPQLSASTSTASVFGGTSGGTDNDMCSCRGAALDEHAPSLVGPLHILSAGNAIVASVLDIPVASNTEETAVVALTTLRGPVASMAVATSKGLIAMLIIADTVQPRWTLSPPQCRSEGDSIVGLRLQCSLASVPSLVLMLLDCVQLPAEETALYCGIPQENIMYAAQPSGVYQVELPWLPRLAALLADASRGHNGSIITSDRQLPPSRICFSSELPQSSPPCLPGIVIIGDVVMGSALVVSMPLGRCQVLAPPLVPPISPLSPLKSRAATASSTTPAEDDVIKDRYGTLLDGPDSSQLPAPTSEAAKFSGTAEGQRWLHDTIVALRGRHIEFAHHASHDLIQHCKRLAINSKSQAEQLTELLAHADQISAKQLSLEQATSRALEVSKNLDARLRLLADLHHSLPRPLSSAERELCQKQLPALERSELAISEQLQDAVLRWARVKDGARGKPSLAKASQSNLAKAVTTRPSISATQAHRVRETLTQQAHMLALNRMKLGAVEEALLL